MKLFTVTCVLCALWCLESKSRRPMHYDLWVLCAVSCLESKSHEPIHCDLLWWLKSKSHGSMHCDLCVLYTLWRLESKSHGSIHCDLCSVRVMMLGVQFTWIYSLWPVFCACYDAWSPIHMNLFIVTCYDAWSPIHMDLLTVTCYNAWSPNHMDSTVACELLPTVRADVDECTKLWNSPWGGGDGAQCDAGEEAIIQVSTSEYTIDKGAISCVLLLVDDWIYKRTLCLRTTKTNTTTLLFLIGNGSEQATTAAWRSPSQL